MVASAMDLIFAADDSMFLEEDFNTSAPLDIHPRKEEILFEGRIIDAEEALEYGLRIVSCHAST